MDTPNLSHVTDEDYSSVYEPAEDSFLMLDALEAEIEFIERLRPAICLEIGPGTGVNVTAFAKAFERCFCMAVDINPRACRVTVDTAKNNGVAVECVNGDLTKNIRDGGVDVIVFNPPYVVTDSSEIGASDIGRAWAGGARGREVIDEFLALLPAVLSEKGVCYMVVVQDNDPDEIIQIVEKMAFDASVVAERKVRNERLKVLKFCRHSPK